MEPPRHKHDCAQCRFLGRYEDVDLYFCQRGPGATVIARYGDAGPNYKSGLAFAPCEPALAEAMKRAVAAGFLRVPY